MVDTCRQKYTEWSRINSSNLMRCHFGTVCSRILWCSQKCSEISR